MRVLPPCPSQGPWRSLGCLCGPRTPSTSRAPRSSPACCLAVPTPPRRRRRCPRCLRRPCAARRRARSWCGGRRLASRLATPSTFGPRTAARTARGRTSTPPLASARPPAPPPTRRCRAACSARPAQRAAWAACRRAAATRPVSRTSRAAAAVGRPRHRRGLAKPLRMTPTTTVWHRPRRRLCRISWRPRRARAPGFGLQPHRCTGVPRANWVPRR
mmetsp:Transcript_148433/g.476701  ORF Transcript_148433/g.476701 Transcript_148433/m.476701 type:complete len:216 (+) Transcript_148433:865-1512(+)